jgi:hypothetical protein
MGDNMTKLEVEIKNVYGKELVYPICETANKFARLIGKKTFTSEDIANIKTLGYQFQVVTKTI